MADLAALHRRKRELGDVGAVRSAMADFARYRLMTAQRDEQVARSRAAMQGDAFDLAAARWDRSLAARAFDPALARAAGQVAAQRHAEWQTAVSSADGATGRREAAGTALLDSLKQQHVAQAAIHQQGKAVERATDEEALLRGEDVAAYARWLGQHG